MSYSMSKTIRTDYKSAIKKVKEVLQSEGFGVITEIDLKNKFKEKLDVDFRNYCILGACNPKMAYEAIQQEDKIGVLLPCNVLVQEMADGKVEVAAINPMESIGSINNDRLTEIAEKISQHLGNVINKL